MKVMEGVTRAVSVSPHYDTRLDASMQVTFALIRHLSQTWNNKYYVILIIHASTLNLLFRFTSFSPFLTTITLHNREQCLTPTETSPMNCLSWLARARRGAKSPHQNRQRGEKQSEPPHTFIVSSQPLCVHLDKVLQ